MNARLIVFLMVLSLAVGLLVVSLTGGPGASAQVPPVSDSRVIACEVLNSARMGSLNPLDHGLLYVAVESYVGSECADIPARVEPPTPVVPDVPTSTPTARPHNHTECHRHYHEVVLGEFDHVHGSDGSVFYVDCSPADGSTPTPRPTSAPVQPYMDFSLVPGIPELTPTPVNMSLVDIEDITNHDWVKFNEPGVYKYITNMEWVRDGITLGPEHSGLGRLFVMFISQKRISSSVSIQDWFVDGLNQVEADAILAFGELARWDEDTALHIVGSPWFVDGPSESEVGVVELLGRLSSLSIHRTEDVARLHWLDNGVNPVEADVVAEILVLSGTVDSELLFELLEMPFMESVERADLGALMSLRMVAEEHPEELDDIFGYKMVSDGIDDFETPLIGALSPEIWRDSLDYEELLVPAITSVVDRWIELPLAGAVRLSVVRSDYGYEGSMDRLEAAVRNAETVVGRPFPTSHVSVVFTPRMRHSLDVSFEGHQVSVRSGYDAEARDDALGVLAGAMARYYWNGNAEWLDTGLAEYMAGVAERQDGDDALWVRNAPCGYARDIKTLEDIRISTYPDCERSLGERLFHDLDLNLSDGDFILGLSRLHIILTEHGRRGDMGDVYRAFDFAPVAREGVIPRWWDGSVSFDVGRLDLSVPDPALWAINGLVIDAAVSYDGVENLDSVVAGGSSGWLSLYLRYRYDYSHSDNSLLLDVVEVYEDGFAYDRGQLEMSAPSRTTGWTVRYVVGASPGSRAAVGRHWIYVYDRERKVAEVSYLALNEPALELPQFDLEGRAARVVSVVGFLDRDSAPDHQTEVEVVFSEPVWVSGDIGVSVLGKGTLLCRNQVGAIPRVDECPTSPDRAVRKLRFFYWTGEPRDKAEMPFVAAGDRIDRFIFSRGSFIRDAEGRGVHYGFGPGEFVRE